MANANLAYDHPPSVKTLDGRFYKLGEDDVVGIDMAWHISEPGMFAVTVHKIEEDTSRINWATGKHPREHIKITIPSRNIAIYDSGIGKVIHLDNGEMELKERV